MKFSLVHIFSVFVKVMLVLGFVIIQLFYTLIIGFGWPFLLFSSLGGCMMETHEYGWPLTFYEVTTGCGMCCDGVGVPFSSFELVYLIIDFVYLSGLSLVCFYIVKIVVIFVKRYVRIFHG